VRVSWTENLGRLSWALVPVLFPFQMFLFLALVLVFVSVNEIIIFLFEPIFVFVDENYTGSMISS